MLEAERPFGKLLQSWRWKMIRLTHTLKSNLQSIMCWVYWTGRCSKNTCGINIAECWGTYWKDGLIDHPKVMSQVMFKWKRVKKGVGRDVKPVQRSNYDTRDLCKSDLDGERQGWKLNCSASNSEKKRICNCFSKEIRSWEKLRAVAGSGERARMKLLAVFEFRRLISCSLTEPQFC